MVAVADLVGSAALVAVIVTLVDTLTDPGAVYRPAPLMFPNAGLMDQVTAVLALFVTVAVNCCVWPSVRDTEVGEILTATAAGACSVILAVPVTEVSKTLVAVTVILWLVAMEAGAA